MVTQIQTEAGTAELVRVDGGYECTIGGEIVQLRRGYSRSGWYAKIGRNTVEANGDVSYPCAHGPFKTRAAALKAVAAMLGFYDQSWKAYRERNALE